MKTVSVAKTVSVNVANAPYSIVIDAGLLSQSGALIAKYLGSARAIIVTDSNVAPLHLATVQASLSVAGITHAAEVIPAGEASKSFAVLEGLLENILARQPDRRTLLIALGGGVVGDLTGLAASLLLRGLPYVQMPTTLLSQVDSAVGGKTAINTRAGKNMVGSFYQPRLVISDTATLSTLPSRELKVGYAEIVKTALLRDAAFFAWLEANGKALLAGDTSLQAEAIAKSCEHKAAIVTEDPTEQGVRALLNLGHTFGHAFEQALGYDGRLLHGEAVALGCVLAAKLSEKLGMIASSDVARITGHFQAVGLPTRLNDLPPLPATQSLIASMRGDKKAENGAFVFILLRRLGEAVVVRTVAESMVVELLQQDL
jgi:3-dehydroquinate synthase